MTTNNTFNRKKPFQKKKLMINLVAIFPILPMIELKEYYQEWHQIISCWNSLIIWRNKCKYTKQTMLMLKKRNDLRKLKFSNRKNFEIKKTIEFDRKPIAILL